MATDILLTVPHGNPADDKLAPAVADSLYAKLQAKGFSAKLLGNMLSRHIVDANRPVGRSLPFRVGVRKEVQFGAKLLIDVHSYPLSAPEYRGDDIVLLRTPQIQDMVFYKRYVLLLNSVAQELGIPSFSAVIAPAKKVDDLVIEAFELGQPSNALMLAEHKEDGDPDLYAHIHAEAIQRLLHSNVVGWV